MLCMLKKLNLCDITCQRNSYLNCCFVYSSLIWWVVKPFLADPLEMAKCQVRILEIFSLHKYTSGNESLVENVQTKMLACLYTYKVYILLAIWLLILSDTGTISYWDPKIKLMLSPHTNCKPYKSLISSVCSKM